MRAPAVVEDLDDYLDAPAQQPELRIYTPICLYFPVSDASSHSAIIQTLKNGLERLSENFPWMAGQLINEGSCDGNTGIFKIKSFEKIPRLIVKDLRDDPSIPTMDALRRANFPSRMLDESVIAPRRTIQRPGESTLDTPIFLVQANFITGGLI